jgi:hypothetical protein
LCITSVASLSIICDILTWNRATDILLNSHKFIAVHKKDIVLDVILL